MTLYIEMDLIYDLKGKSVFMAKVGSNVNNKAYILIPVASSYWLIENEKKDLTVNKA